jgi:Tfp pilus assembly protein PilV
MQTRRRRRGATLIELVVALLLFDLTLLALVGATALTARRIGDAQRRQRALMAATSRAERFIASPCALPWSGQATTERGVVERWSSSLFAGGRSITDSVVISPRGGALAMRATQAC